MNQNEEFISPYTTHDRIKRIIWMIFWTILARPFLGVWPINGKYSYSDHLELKLQKMLMYILLPIYSCLGI